MVAQRQNIEAGADSRSDLCAVHSDGDQAEGQYVLSFKDRAELGLVTSQEWYERRDEQLLAAQNAWLACQGRSRDHRSWDAVNQAHWWAQQYEIAGQRAQRIEDLNAYHAQLQPQRLAAAEQYIQAAIDQYLTGQDGDVLTPIALAAS